MKIPLKSIILLVAAFISPALTFGASGDSLYSKHCSACHGDKGQGASGPALRKEGLLRTVGPGYFVNTIRFGRTRGCPSFEGKLSGDEIESISLYIKGWQKGSMLDAPERAVEPKKTARAEDFFTLCGGCHGLEGEGAMGPPLLDPGLLKSISDTELRRTIMWGRPGTPMKGYLKGQGGLATLTIDEIDEIISYIRYRQTEK